MRCSHCSHCYHAKKREGEGMHSEREMVDAHYRAWRGCGFCSRAGAVVPPVWGRGGLRSIALPNFGNRQLNAVRTIGKTVRGGIPWGLMCGAGGAWKVWGAHAGNRSLRQIFVRAGFGGWGYLLPLAAAGPVEPLPYMELAGRVGVACTPRHRPCTPTFPKCTPKCTPTYPRIPAHFGARSRTSKSHSP